MGKLKYIDALRGIAVLGVVAVHCSQYGINNYPSYISRFFGQGARGVQLFFIVSAFTIFLSQKKRNSFEERPYRNFFVRRFFRIAPMYYLAIGYFIIQNFHKALLDKNWDWGLVSNVFANLTFLHGFSPYWINSLVPGGWSIAVEMTFYLIVPFLVTKIRTTNQAIWLMLIAILGSKVLEIGLLNFPLIEDD